MNRASVAQTQASLTTMTTTTTTTTTSTKPSFTKPWALTSLAPQQGSFQRIMNQRVEELAEQNTFHQQATELENTCKYMAKFSLLQLRACHKVRHHLSLQHHDRAKTNFDNELQENFCSFKLGRNRARELEKYCTELRKKIDEEKSKMHRQLSKLELSKIDDNELPTNNDNKNESQEELCSFRLAASSLCFHAVHYIFFKISFSTKFVHNKLRNENENENEKKNELVKYNLRSQLQQQLPTVTFKKKKEQLDNLHDAEILSDQLADFKVDSNFYLAASKIKLHNSLGVQLLQQQLPGQQLDRRDPQQDNFSDSSLAEESFRQATSPTAAGKKRPSERQLHRQQVGRRDLQHSGFKESSLEKAHFALATSKRTA